MPKPKTPRKARTAGGTPPPRMRKSGTPAAGPSGTSSTARLSHEEIAARAYAIFQARGGRPGDDWADWFQAEAELRRGGAGGGEAQPGADASGESPSGGRGLPERTTG